MEIFTTTWNVISKIYSTTTIIISVITIILFCKMHVSEVISAAAAKSLQSCPTLCDPIDGNPPGFPVPGSLWARILEWVAISFSNA